MNLLLSGYKSTAKVERKSDGLFLQHQNLGERFIEAKKTER